MFKILYLVDVHYTSEIESGIKQYEFYAINEDNAKNIATEMFSMVYGIPKRIYVVCTPREPSSNIALQVIALSKALLVEYNSIVSGKNYVGFLNLFEQYKGYGLMLNREIPHFSIDMGVLIFRVIFVKPTTGIDKKVLVRYNGMEYIVDDLKKVYFGKA